MSGNVANHRVVGENMEKLTYATYLAAAWILTVVSTPQLLSGQNLASSGPRSPSPHRIDESPEAGADPRTRPSGPYEVHGIQFRQRSIERDFERVMRSVHGDVARFRLEVPMPREQSPALHVALGALIGSAAVVSAIVYFPSDEAIITPGSLVPGAVGGAIVGGVAGWVIYRIRR